MYGGTEYYHTQISAILFCFHTPHGQNKISSTVHLKLINHTFAGSLKIFYKCKCTCAPSHMYMYKFLYEFILTLRLMTEEDWNPFPIYITPKRLSNKRLKTLSFNESLKQITHSRFFYSPKI